MNQEDLKKALAALGNVTINVAGDFVQEKNQTFNYTIEKVEAGGIGMQFVKGEEFAAEQAKQKDGPELPSREQMAQAVIATFKEGLWWSSRSWAVVYRVYQMKGYVNGFTQFVREVKEWGIKIDFKCNYDAVQKPMVSGQLSGTPDKWEAQGAHRQAVKLAEALLRELEKQC